MGLTRAICAAGLAFATLGAGGALVARQLVPPAADAEVRVAAPTPSVSSAAPACGPGQDSVLAVADRSAPGGRRSVWVHRPAGQDRADIPVLYLLHGYPADPTALVNSSLLHRLDGEMCRTGRPFVVAVPDGRAGIGLVPRINEPESGLTAAEHVRERELLLGRPPRGRVDLPVDPATLGRDLPAYQRQRLMLALATLDGPELVVADDVDLGLSTVERQELWRAFADLTGQGYAVIVACREVAGPATEYPMEGHR